MNTRLETKQLSQPPTRDNVPGSLLGVGLNNNLSISVAVPKGIDTGRVGLRHMIGLGNQIDQHKLKAQQLRKLTKCAWRSTVTTTTKRWFVLYDSSNNGSGNGGQGKLLLLTQYECYFL